MKQKLIDLYISYTLNNNKTPESVYQFAKIAEIDEAAFYNFFASIDSLESEIFCNWFENALKINNQSEFWETYSSREKTLAVFFSFIEAAKKQRSFCVFLKNKEITKLPKLPSYFKNLHANFKEKINTILAEGIENKEIENRKVIVSKYAEGLWVNFLFVYSFWLKDESNAFEKTDEAIERSINLAFDLMGKSALDSALDFGKFLFQNR